MASAAAASSGGRVRRHNSNDNDKKHKHKQPDIIAPRFVAAVPTTLVFKEKRSGDSKNVRDASGNVVFKLDARRLTLSKRRVLRDRQGADVGHMRHNRREKDTTWYLGVSGNDKRGYVQHRGPEAPDSDRIQADVVLSPQFTFMNPDDQVVGRAEGDWRSRECLIRLFGETAAEVARGGGGGGGAALDSDADSYRVDVAAGMDTAFVTMIVFALNEIYLEDDEGDD